MRKASNAGLIVAALVGALYWPCPTHAADPQPYKVEMGPTNDKALNATLKATSELESLRKSAPVGPFGLIGRARGDLERLKAVLESVGFYEGSVSITIDGLPLNDPGPRRRTDIALQGQRRADQDHIQHRPALSPAHSRDRRGSPRGVQESIGPYAVSSRSPAASSRSPTAM